MFGPMSPDPAGFRSQEGVRDVGDYNYYDPIGRSPYYDPQYQENERRITEEAMRSSSARQILFDVVGGTGAVAVARGGDIASYDHARAVALRRMRYQDEAVMLLLLIAYVGSLAFSASLVYKQASNDSPITYYADPRHHAAVIHGHDLDGFLEAFDQPPKDMQLQITGLKRLEEETDESPPISGSSTISWLGVRYDVAFSYALDLSPWVVAEGIREPAEAAGISGAGTEASPPRTHGAGISAEDIHRLRDYLANDHNDLSIVEIRKEVAWPSWEELATNIKQRIRQQGFDGVVTVRRSDEESVKVYKNRPWANFMHSQATRMICALSIVGLLVYQPYIWWRCRVTTVRSRYCIGVDINSYWPLIADRIGVGGFIPEGSANPVVESNH